MKKDLKEEEVVAEEEILKETIIIEVEEEEVIITMRKEQNIGVVIEDAVEEIIIKHLMIPKLLVMLGKNK